MQNQEESEEVEAGGVGRVEEAMVATTRAQRKKQEAQELRRLEKEKPSGVQPRRRVYGSRGEPDAEEAEAVGERFVEDLFLEERERPKATRSHEEERQATSWAGAS